MNKNFIVKIANGFGNQMFLYATAYAFSKRLGYKLLIDDETGIIHDANKRRKRKRLNWTPNYELDIFNLKSEIADKKYKFLTNLDHIKRKCLKFIDKYANEKSFLLEKLDKNKKTIFSSSYLDQKYNNTIFFEGYFESENYFKEFKNDLVEEFSFKSFPNLENNIFKKIINDSNVVSIALRRRRYTEIVGKDLDNKNVKKSEDFENLTIKYIYRAIEYFKTHVENPKFLVWSDSFENLEKHFDPNKFIFVKNDVKKKIFLDFFLMRQCKYFIVGPTSFHWWAAWLCNKDDKIIVRPKDNELNQSSNADFWPESWTKI